jgi:hypothetical protein
MRAEMSTVLLDAVPGAGGVGVMELCQEHREEPIDAPDVVVGQQIRGESLDMVRSRWNIHPVRRARNPWPAPRTNSRTAAASAGRPPCRRRRDGGGDQPPPDNRTLHGHGDAQTGQRVEIRRVRYRHTPTPSPTRSAPPRPWQAAAQSRKPSPAPAGSGVFSPASVGCGPLRASGVERSSMVVTCYLPATAVLCCVVTRGWGDSVWARERGDELAVYGWGRSFRARSLVRSKRDSAGPTMVLAVAVSTPGCGWVGAMAAAALTTAVSAPSCAAGTSRRR